MKHGRKLEEAGALPEHVHFPVSALLSVTVRSAGRQIEVALIGNEGIAGASALLGPQAAVNDVTVQIAGDAWQVETAKLLDVLPACPELREMLLHYAGALLQQISQTALVTGHARIEQRLARWLLMVGERADFDRIEITHADLSKALGVRRAGITVAMHLLESQGAVKSMRKLVRVLDTEALASIADGFYSPLSH